MSSAAAHVPSSMMYFLALTQHVVMMIGGFVTVAAVMWVGILILGYSGHWNILRHQDVDLTDKVQSFKDHPASQRSYNSDFTGPRLETPIELPFTEPLFGTFRKDQRDLPLLHVLVSSTCILVPLAFLNYYLFMNYNFIVASVFGLVIYQFIRVRFCCCITVTL
mmetsp:Transcript_7400/g.18194  ORF Transcript_7400/g.18194 Transcript_7400/m.18194 type:complete len:164 (+) Transcript_7400:321-812(+)